MRVKAIKYMGQRGFGFEESEMTDARYDLIMLNDGVLAVDKQRAPGQADRAFLYPMSSIIIVPYDNFIESLLEADREPVAPEPEDDRGRKRNK